jgi:hypothetical protein
MLITLLSPALVVPVVLLLLDDVRLLMKKAAEIKTTHASDKSHTYRLRSLVANRPSTSVSLDSLI